MPDTSGFPRPLLGVLAPVIALVGATLVGCAGPAGSTAAPGVATSRTAAAPAGGPSAGAASSLPTKVGTEGATVATFHGNGGKAEDTAAFTVHGAKVRFVYTVQPNDVGPVPFLWSMYDEGSAVKPASPRARNSCASCDGEQTNDLGTVPAGSYYLHVITSRPWKLTVLEG